MIIPNDILLRDTSDGTTVWVSQRLVVERSGVSDDHLRTVCRDRYKHSLPASWQAVSGQAEFFLGRRPGRSWRWGRKNGQYYYDIDTIPNRKPVCYRDRLPSKEDLIAQVDEHRLRGSRERQAEIRQSIVAMVNELYQDSDAVWINTRSGYQINCATARDYARALAWARFTTRTVKNEKYEDYGFTTLDAFYRGCAGIITTEKLSNFSTSTPESLRNKLRSFPIDQSDQRVWIISGRLGNNNSLKVGKRQIVDPETGEIFPFDLHQAIMYAAYMNIDNPQKESLIELYQDTYEPTISEFGEYPISYRSFCNHLTRLSTRLKADLQRHGEEYYKKHMLTYTPTQKLTYAHSLFAGDGSSTIQYHYWKRVKTDNGKWKD